MSSKLLAEWFWVDRWMGSSAFLLPMEARGVYREMLSQAWRRGARLPADHDAIKRAIGASDAEWSRSWPLVEKFWRVDGDSMVNDTQAEVYEGCLGRKASKAKGGVTRASSAERSRGRFTPAHVPAETPADRPAGHQRANQPPSPSPSPTTNPIQSPSSPSVDSRSADDDARSDLIAALSTIQASAEFRGMEAQAILNLPRFCAASGPVRLAGNPPDGLMRATAGKLRAYGRPTPAKLNGVPAWDRGADHAVSDEEATAWDPRLGPRHAAEPNSGSAA